MVLRATYRNSCPEVTENPGVLCRPMPKAEGDITLKGFPVTGDKYSGIVVREDMYYMLYITFFKNQNQFKNRPRVIALCNSNA